MKIRRICAAAVIAVAGLAIAAPVASADVVVYRHTSSQVSVWPIEVDHETATFVHVG
ncbi:hypothetical protein [Yinghuangia sp. YIM S09857]|uniref:hypothetical protein n=1 Tax=Yinghuangia sp. YIM S09857 TaxID=3436929 RepID=UPI003F534DF3